MPLSIAAFLKMWINKFDLVFHFFWLATYGKSLVAVDPDFFFHI